MDERVQFKSGGLRLAGLLQLPDDLKAGERRPAVMVLHGFGSNKASAMMGVVAALFSSLGYIVLRFDMRGCGESEGERGRGQVRAGQVHEPAGAEDVGERLVRDGWQIRQAVATLKPLSSRSGSSTCIALVRSIATTRGSLRSFHSSAP